MKRKNGTMTRPLGALVLATLALSACAELGIEMPAPFAPAAEDAPAPGTVTDSETGTTELAAPHHIDPPLPRRKPAVPEGYAAAAKAAEAPPPEGAEPPAQSAEATAGDTSLPRADPEALVGLDFARTRELLGAPALLMEEPPAKIWAYNGRSCVLHLHFYPKVGGSDFRVLTYNMVGEETGEEEDVVAAFRSRCLSELLADAKSGKSSAAAQNRTIDETEEEAQSAE